MASNIGKPKDNKLDPVAVNEVWRERISKELKGQNIRSEFRVNPKKVIPLTEKPQEVPLGNINNDDSGLNKKEIDEEVDKIMKSLYENKKRVDEFGLPLTTGQEIGLDVDPLISDKDLPNKFAKKGKGQSEITKYADAYVISNGKSPFSS